MKKILSALSVMGVMLVATPAFACWTPCAPQPVHCYTVPCPVVVHCYNVPCPGHFYPVISQCHPRCR